MPFQWPHNEGGQHLTTKQMRKMFDSALHIITRKDPMEVAKALGEFREKYGEGLDYTMCQGVVARYVQVVDNKVNALDTAVTECLDLIEKLNMANGLMLQKIEQLDAALAKLRPPEENVHLTDV